MELIRRIWAPVVGLIAIIAGFVIPASAPASFGWFAYAPLAQATFFPPFVTPHLVAGIAIGVAGLALIAGWVGYRLGARSKG